MRFRIIREGGKFFIEYLQKVGAVEAMGKKKDQYKWVAFPKHKSEKFHSPEQAERWLVDHGNWKLIHEREIIKEIEIDPETESVTNEIGMR